MTSPIMLDLSRLLANAHRRVPSGIDRVELAYAEYLQELEPERCQFVTIDFLGRIRDLPSVRTKNFVAAIGAVWRGQRASSTGITASAWILWLQAVLGLPFRSKRPSRGVRPILLLVAHKHLLRRRRIEAAITSSDAHLVAFVHDLIPIDYPEYVRPHHAALHVRRIETVGALAEAVIVNSHSTAAALRPWLAAAGRSPRLLIAPLGVDFQQMQPAPSDGNTRPYFVVVSTIEPRKNHLLLLHIWRRLSERHGKAAPRLVLVGRRGWENENIVDLLERSPAIIDLVTENSDLSDWEMQNLLRGSRAVLFPSFAEGYGLPLAEALTAGVPALCGDIPALREVGGDVPEYLDPLDGLGWLEAIEAYSVVGSPCRTAQLDRLSAWTAPRWRRHFQDVFAFLETVALQGSATRAPTAPCGRRDTAPTQGNTEPPSPEPASSRQTRQDFNAVGIG